MALSRNPREYLERVGIEEPRFPRPRLDVDYLTPVNLPIDPEEELFPALRDREGPTPPDRAGVLEPWPDQNEEFQEHEDE